MTGGLDPRPVLPAAREPLVRLALRAEQLRDAALARLSPVGRSLLDTTDPAEFARTSGRLRPFRDYWAVTRTASARWDAATRDSNPEWMATFAQLVMLESVASMPAGRPRFNIPAGIWPAHEDGIALLLDAVEGYSGSGLRDHAWLKDLSIAQFRSVSYTALVNVPTLIRPAVLLRHATAREMLAMAALLRLGYVRQRLYIVSHAWRGYRESMDATDFDHSRHHRRALYAANPQIRGKLWAGWMIDPALKAISPRQFERWQFPMSYGGRRFRMANDGGTAGHAIAVSDTRRKLYEEGKYRPQVYGILHGREGIPRNRQREQ